MKRSSNFYKLRRNLFGAFVKIELYRSLATASLTFVALAFPVSSYAQNSRSGYNPALREPLMRASVAVELIPSASAEETDQTSDEMLQHEEDLKNMEAELLAALDGSSKEAPTKDVGNTHKIADITAPTPLTQPKVTQPKVEEQKAFPIANAPEPKPLQEIKQQLDTRPKVPVTTARKTRPVIARAVTQDAPNDGTSDLSQKLSIAESQVKILSRELDLSRRSLSSAEERIDELSSLVKSSQPARPDGLGAAVTTDRGSLSGSAIPVDASDDFAVSSPSRKAITQQTSRATAAANAIDYNEYDSSLRDSSTATIIVDKAPLRVGPGKQESAMYTLPRLSEVKIEYRSGEWYRIIASGGLRGWIYGSSLRFETGVSPASTVRIGGVRAGYEPVSLK